MNTDTITNRVIAVDYGKPLPDMIAGGKYDWVNPNITAERFPVEETGRKQFRAKLFHFDRYISSDDAVAAMKAENFLPATHVHGLAFGAARLSRFVRAGVRQPPRRVPRRGWRRAGPQPQRLVWRLERQLALSRRSRGLRRLMLSTLPLDLRTLFSSPGATSRRAFVYLLVCVSTRFCDFDPHLLYFGA
jgi:hypothetical protein